MYKVEKLELEGCLELIPNIYEDNRGITIKPYHIIDFKKMGIKEVFKEDLIVISKKNVIRGMHFQSPPFAQAKIVYCLKGSVLDIILDIRNESPTYGNFIKVNLNDKNKNMIYIPSGYAHGYLSLEEDSIVVYKMSNVYNQEYEDGIRFDSFGMNWEYKDIIVSERDKSFVGINEFATPFI